METLLSCLSFLVYVGVVFVLPSVLGRKAARSRKARVPFQILLGLFAIAAIGAVLAIKEGPKLLHDPRAAEHYPNIHDLENHAIGVMLFFPMLAATLVIGIILGLCFYWGTGRPGEEEKKGLQEPGGGPKPSDRSEGDP